MKGYLVLAHTSKGGVHTAHSAYAVSAADHQAAAAQVHALSDATLRVDTVMRLREDTLDHLRLTPGEPWLL